jgi:hypothetical protein
LEKIITRRSTQLNSLALCILAADVPIAALILWILVQVATWWVQSAFRIYSPVDTTLEQAIFWNARFLAWPCAIFSLIASISSLIQRRTRKIAVASILLSVPGILLGLLAWIFFFAMSSFTF